MNVVTGFTPAWRQTIQLISEMPKLRTRNFSIANRNLIAAPDPWWSDFSCLHAAGPQMRGVPPTVGAAIVMRTDFVVACPRHNRRQGQGGSRGCQEFVVGERQ